MLLASIWKLQIYMYTETFLPVFSDIRRVVSESSANLKVSLNLFAEIPPGALNGR